MKIGDFKARIGNIVYFTDKVQETKKTAKYQIHVSKVHLKEGAEPKPINENWYYASVLLYEILSFGKSQEWQTVIFLTKEEYEQQPYQKGDVIQVTKGTFKSKKRYLVSKDKDKINKFSNPNDRRVVSNEVGEKTLIHKEYFTLVKLTLNSKNITLLQRENDDYTIKVGELEYRLDKDNKQHLKKNIVTVLENKHLEFAEPLENTEVFAEIYASFGKWKRFRVFVTLRHLPDDMFEITLAKTAKFSNDIVYDEYWFEFCGYRFDKIQEEFFETEHTFYIGENTDKNAKELFADLELFDKTEIKLSSFCSKPPAYESDITIRQLSSNVPAYVETAEIDNHYYLTLSIHDTDEREKIPMLYSEYSPLRKKYDIIKFSYNPTTKMCLVRKKEPKPKTNKKTTKKGEEKQ